MKTFFAPLARTGRSLAALAAALALTASGAAQEIERQPDFSDPPRVRIERDAPRAERPRTPARFDAPAPVQDQAPRDARPRFERSAPPPSAATAAPTERRAPRGFGGDVIARAQGGQQAERRGEQRAVRIEQRNEQSGARVDRRSDQRAERVEQRGDVRASQLDWRGRDTAAAQVDRPSDQRAERIERRGDQVAGGIEARGDRRADRIEDRSDRRGDRVSGRQGGWQGHDQRSGSGFSGQVGDIAHDARRAEQRRDWRHDERRRDHRDEWRRDDRRHWRHDDWRWGWNGRSGWDSREFRRWNRNWRSNRSYDWFDYRRANTIIFRPGPYYAPYRSHRYSRLSIGFFLDSLFFQPRFFINDPWVYRLPAVYGPYQWVRYYDDVLLVDVYTGEVVDVIYDFFW
jgi:hypothetical protein